MTTTPPARGPQIVDLDEIGGIEGFFNQMRESEAAANATARADQREIGWGDCFFRMWDTGFGGEILFIFGEIVTLEWMQEHEPEAFDHMLEVYDRGYRFAMCHSTVEPAGEYGDTHFSTMDKITKAQFEAARECGWDPRKWAATEVGRQAILNAAYNEVQR